MLRLSRAPPPHNLVYESLYAVLELGSVKSLVVFSHIVVCNVHESHELWHATSQGPVHPQFGSSVQFFDPTSSVLV
jgi:hypothetical protein